MSCVKIYWNILSQQKINIFFLKLLKKFYKNIYYKNWHFHELCHELCHDYVMYLFFFMIIDYDQFIKVNKYFK